MNNCITIGNFIYIKIHLADRHFIQVIYLCVSLMKIVNLYNEMGKISVVYYGNIFSLNIWFAACVFFIISV